LRHKIIPKSIRSLLKPMYFGWHRLLYSIYYGIPFFNTPVNPKRFVRFFDWIGNIESAVIIGKGASIFESNPLPIIQSCDFKCLMNSVDVSYLEPYIGRNFDVQITTHVSKVNSIIPVLSKENINKIGLRLLICNNNREHSNGETVRNYWNFFNNRVEKISCLPSPEEFEFNPDIYRFGDKLTIASSVLMMLYNVKTVKKIVFVGVDAFHFGYSYRPGVNENDRHFYPLKLGGYDDSRTSHGIPFLKFLFESLRLINEKRLVEVYFPEVLRKYIDFPDEAYIHFYE
jgi:hypothetical protein